MRAQLDRENAGHFHVQRRLDSLIRAGFLQLQPGDAVFARDIHGGSQDTDVLLTLRWNEYVLDIFDDTLPLNV